LAALTIWGNRIREWDVDTQEEVGSYGPDDFPGKEPWAMHLSYSPAGDLLATVRVDKRCVLWHCRNRRIIAELNSNDEFAPNDFIELGFLIADAGKGRWKVWRLDTGEFTGEFPQAPDGFSLPSHIALSRDGRLMVHGSQKHLKFYHADGTTRELTPFNASHVPVLSPDNNLLAVFAWQNLRERRPNVLEWLRVVKPPDRWATLKLHDVRDGREIAAFPKGNAACFAPDGQTLLVLSDDQTLQVWDIPPRPPWWRIGGVGALAGAVVLLGGKLCRRRDGAVKSPAGPTAK
jgi:WD40 repeat protein